VQGWAGLDSDRNRACTGAASRELTGARLPGDCRFLGSSDDLLRYGPTYRLPTDLDSYPSSSSYRMFTTSSFLLSSSLTTLPQLSFETDIAFPLLLLRQVLLDIASILPQLKPNTAL
jgi:hypothetical protein